MPRVKRAVHAQKKRRAVLEQAKGYWGWKHSHYRYAKEQVERSLVYAYRDRKVKKRTFRQLWITRINAAARANGLSYNQFIHGLRQGRHRARPQGPRGSRGERSRGVHGDRRPGEVRPSGLITSRDNERLKLVRKLHDRRWRDKLELFVAEGEDLVEAAGRRSSRSTCSSRARTSSRRCSPRCRRSRIRRACSASSGAPTCRAACGR